MSGAIKFRGPLRYIYTVRGRSSWTFVVLTILLKSENTREVYEGRREKKKTFLLSDIFVINIVISNLKGATGYDNSIKYIWEIKWFKN